VRHLEKTAVIPGLQPGKKALVVFFEADCPTCQLTLPYLNALGSGPIQVIGLSQDDEASTRELVRELKIVYPVELDRGLKASRAYAPQTVPAFYLLDENGQVERMMERPRGSPAAAPAIWSRILKMRASAAASPFQAGLFCVQRRGRLRAFRSTTMKISLNIAAGILATRCPSFHPRWRKLKPWSGHAVWRRRR
jgi:peroxiredoxin